MAVEVTFRPSGHADLPVLHALVERAYRGDSARAGWTHEADLVSGPRTTREALAAAIDAPDELLLLAEEQGAIVGCVQLTHHGAGRAYFGLLTVDPLRQAGGLGRAIIAAAEGEAVRRFGARRMELTVVSQRPELIAYYRRRGYAPTGERRPFPVPLDPPLELLVLEKPL